ncbi:MAG: ECF transporter S component [Eubacteriales bacterium]|nr:ECF transporter S component [Eubacteriales bacterium]
MKKPSILQLCLMAMMIALVFVANYVRIPFFSSYLHIANAVCVLAGFLFGGVQGALIAGLGSALFDLSFPAFVSEAPITFINKGLMVLVASLVYNKIKGEKALYIGSFAGAFTYVALYLVKSYIQKRFIAPVPLETLGAVLLQKLSASSINAVFAGICAPLFYKAVNAALQKSKIKLK